MKFKGSLLVETLAQYGGPAAQAALTAAMSHADDEVSTDEAGRLILASMASRLGCEPQLLPFVRADLRLGQLTATLDPAYMPTHPLLSLWSFTVAHEAVGNALRYGAGFANFALGAPKVRSLHLEADGFGALRAGLVLNFTADVGEGSALLLYGAEPTQLNFSSSVALSGDLLALMRASACIVGVSPSLQLEPVTFH